MDTPKNDWRLERWIAVLLSLLYLLPFVARAETFPPQEPAGLHLLTPDGGEWEPAVMLSSDWDLEIAESSAKVRLVQHFRNETGSSVDGAYILSLPVDAAVDWLAVTIGERVAYDSDASNGARPEPLGDGLLSIAITNMHPGEEAIVEASWHQPIRLGASGGSVTIPTITAFPVALSEPQGPSRPESSPLPNMVISHGVAPSATIDVRLLGREHIVSIGSPSHPGATTHADGAEEWRISTSSAPANREFILRWQYSEVRTSSASPFTAELRR